MDGESITLGKLQDRFPEEVVETHARPGDDEAVVKKGRIVEICRFLRDDPDLAFDYCMDVCGVDYLEMERTPRFACVYHLYSLEKNHRIRIKVPIEETDPELDSVTGVWPGANWFEREAFDLFGIRFRGHPFLRRILTHHQFVGHPLRKDYDHGKRQQCTEVWDLEFE